MSVSTQALLEYAFTLIHDGGDELVLRNAVGRAYYAAFNHASSLDSVIPHYQSDVRCGVHQQKINQLKSVCVANDIGITPEVSKLFRKLAMVLSDMKIKRTIADYHLSDELNISTATLVCAQAKKFIEDCDSILAVLNEASVQSQPA